jgi:hypothetical protein
MKNLVAILFLMALPVAAMSQQSSANPSDGKDCPLSHWSTTGAACLYAPDLIPADESTLKPTFLRTTLDANGDLLGGMPSKNSSSLSHQIFSPYFERRPLYNVSQKQLMLDSSTNELKIVDPH